MSDSSVTVYNTTSGAVVATRQVVVSGNTVQLQCVVLGDPSTADSYAAVTAKGTQGAFGMASQDLKDAGRNPITLYATPVAGNGATEVLMTITQVKGGVSQAAATNYTVTSGKTFRITSFTVFGTDTTTTNYWIRGTMRYTTSGTVASTSGPIMMAQTNPVAAVANTPCLPVTIPVSDGYEIPSGASYGISQQTQNVSTTIGVCVTGFEY